MKEVVIFTDAYPRIKNALYIATQNYNKRHITIVIMGNSDLFEFFKAANEKLFNNEISLIYFSLFQPDSRRITAKGIKKVFYIFSDIIRERRSLREIYNKYLAQFQGCDAFFFSKGFIDFYVVKRLSKRNGLVYIPSYPPLVTPVQYSPRSVTDLLKLMIFTLIYGRGIALGQLPHLKGIRHMSDRFMKEKVDRVIDGEEKEEMLKDFNLNQFKLFDFSKYRFYYFPQGLLEDDYIVDKDTYRREMVEIFSIISKYFPENEIAIKYYAGCPESEKAVVKVGDVLPDYIPAEFLYDDSVRMYLGVWSSAIANVEKGLAVSIMYLISHKSNETRETMKEILKNMSRSEILFPKSLDEFEKILADINKPQM